MNSLLAALVITCVVRYYYFKLLTICTLDTIETLKEYIGDQAISILEKINLLGKIQYAMVKYKNNTIHFDLFPSGSEFKARRMNLGLTLSEVASLIDLPKSTISRLERGLEVYYSSVKAINEFYVRNGV